MSNIPKLTYAIRHSLDRLEWQAGIYNEEFTERMRLAMGHPDYFTTTTFGVVAPADPQSAIAGGSAPLSVSANSTNTLNVDVVPGMAVTKSGQWLKLDDYVRNVSLSDTALSVPNVVYLYYRLVDGPLGVNDHNDPVVTLETRPEDPINDSLTTESYYVAIDTVDTYLSYTESQREDMVPLAIVTVQQVQDPITLVTTTQLDIDHTTNSYSWNRPWFSMNDVEHRARLGTGTQSDSNPHAISQNDLTVGAFSTAQLLLDHGMIIADDQTVAKVPGYRCESVIPGSQLTMDDASGTLTGFPNKYYLELPYFPVRLGRVWLDSSGKDIAADLVPETNRIVFSSDAALPIGDSYHVYYTRAEACEPPTTTNGNTYSTNNPTANELVVGGGVFHTSLSSTEESFGDAYQFPMRYLMFVDADGTLMKTPQVIYCYKRLDDISTTDTPTITQYGPAYIMMGLIGAASVATMSVKVRVYGTDSTGASINQLFVYSGGTWVDPGPVPNSSVTDDALEISGSIFSSITSIQIEERIDDGPNSAIMIWALLNPTDTYAKMKDAALISDIMWNGLWMSDIRDKRIVSTSVRDFMITSDVSLSNAFWFQTLVGGNASIYVEDFRAPRYGDLRDESGYSKPGSTYPWGRSNKLMVGRNGYYQTRALSVLDAFGTYWRVSMMPPPFGTKFNLVPNSYTAPQIRGYDGGTSTWSSWTDMFVTIGTPGSWSYSFATYTPQMVQFRLATDLIYETQAAVFYG